ncbi:hypothetical protein XINFAN_02035 [Pseudogemmobacter humi]|uniref:DUF4326 domain-containing protein n=2 Tax=Pseudogemmobacter humi TaxID=2483812 RepID=A0A3P5XHR8_9RHOB|nr:hypothetical protein XINFAN_02035 [Pseudogemmobacter humi]
MPKAMTVVDAVTAHATWLRDGTILMPENLSPSGEYLIRDSLTDLRSLVLDMLPRFRGCNFACWCRPGSPCHADTLMRIANG